MQPEAPRGRRSLMCHRHLIYETSPSAAYEISCSARVGGVRHWHGIQFRCRTNARRECCSSVCPLTLVVTVCAENLIPAVAAAFRSRVQLIAENLCLRQQSLVLQHRHPQPRVGNADRRFRIIVIS